MPPRLKLDLKRWKKDPRVVTRLVLGVLLLANLVAAAVAFKPWASSVEDLERQAASLRQQIRQKQGSLDHLRAVVDKVQSARTDGDRFMGKYLLGTRSMSSTLALELEQMARKSGIRQKDTTFSFEPVEGSDTLTKVVITAVYEGTYADLMHFLNLLDRSERFLIVESLGAAPQQAGLMLGVTMKFSAFVQEGGELPAEMLAVTNSPSNPAPLPPRRQLPAPVVSIQRPSAPAPAFATPPPASDAPQLPLRRRGRTPR